MRKPIIIIGGVLLLIIGAFGIGWGYYRSNPEAWDAFLAEMEGNGGSSPAVSPRAVSRPAQRLGSLMASGNVEAEEVTVAAQIGGRVTGIYVDEGDTVNSEDLLLRLDQSSLLAKRTSVAAAVAQAQAAVDAAQAQLDLAEAGATAAEIAAAEAAVLAAQGAVAAAEAALNQAEISAGSARTVQTAENSVSIAETIVAQAEGNVELAEAGLAAANAELARLQAGATPEEIAMYQALVNQAHSNFLYYENIHFTNFIDNDIGGAPEEQARYLREAARGAWDAALAQLNKANAGATAAEIAAAVANRNAAAAQLTIAEARLAMSEAEMAQVMGNVPTTEDRVALADAGVTVAAAQVEVAQGQLAQAEAALAQLRAGATAEELAMLAAEVSAAEAALAAAEANLSAVDIEISRATLTSPAGGIIVQSLIHEGELAAPGAPLFTLTDLDTVQLTVYVPEANLGQVALGQMVDVTVDAYDKLFTGQVAHIASAAEFTPKNVQTPEERVHMVFAVEIRLDNPDHLLKPGMPADAVFR